MNAKLSNALGEGQGASGRLCAGEPPARTLCGISAPCQWEAGTICCVLGPMEAVLMVLGIVSMQAESI